MSYGLSPYGLSPYGLASPSVLDVEYVLTIATTVVRVYLSGEPQHSNYFTFGDARNPLSWTITAPDGSVVQVVGVIEVSSTVYELVVLKPLTGSPDIFTLTWNLLAPSGAPFLPGSAPFYGMTATISSADVHVPGDLRNPQTSPDANGVLTVGSSGDYDNESGASFIRKLIIRRLTTVPGEFFFMPSYGVGLRLKEPVPVADLPALKTLIETQLRREPELYTCTVRLTLDDKRGIMFVTVRTPSLGKDASTTIEIPQTNI